METLFATPVNRTIQLRERLVHSAHWTLQLSWQIANISLAGVKVNNTTYRWRTLNSQIANEPSQCPQVNIKIFVNNSQKCSCETIVCSAGRYRLRPAACVFRRHPVVPWRTTLSDVNKIFRFDTDNNTLT